MPFSVIIVIVVFDLVLTFVLNIVRGSISLSLFFLQHTHTQVFAEEEGSGIFVGFISDSRGINDF